MGQGQSVWHRNDLANQAQSALNMAIAASDNASPEFVRGVYCGLAVLCNGIGAPAPVLPRREPVAVVVIDAAGMEVTG